MWEPACVWSNRASHGKQKIRKEQKTPTYSIVPILPKGCASKAKCPTPLQCIPAPAFTARIQEHPNPTPLSSPSRIQKQEPGEPFKLATGLLEVFSCLSFPTASTGHPQSTSRCLHPRTEQRRRGGESSWFAPGGSAATPTHPSLFCRHLLCAQHTHSPDAPSLPYISGLFHRCLNLSAVEASGSTQPKPK